MVLPANSQSAQAALHGVRVEGDAGIAQEPLKSLPVPQRITDRLAEGRARQDRLRRQPRLDARDHGARLRVPQPSEHGEPLIWPDLDGPCLDRVQRADLLDQLRGLRVMRLRLDEPAARVDPTEGEREGRWAVAALCPLVAQRLVCAVASTTAIRW